jgi:integrase
MPAAIKKTALTDRSLKALKPASDGRRQIVWDSLMPGMAVRVSALGKRSFYAVKRRPGDVQPVWHLLGAYPVMGLGEARSAAREALSALMAGQHPRRLADERRRATEAATREADANTFSAVAERFDRLYLSRELAASSVRHYRRYLSRELVPALGTKQITEIKRRDIVAVISGVAERSGKSSAIGALAVLRKMLNWTLNQDIPGFESNPASAINTADVIGRTKARDRLISDVELAAIWHATPSAGEPFASAYKILMLTGLRLNEVAAACWKDLDLAGATLTIPAGRSKTGDAQLVPLPPAAVELFRAMPRFTGPDPDRHFIFTTTAGERPIQGFSHAKDRLDRALAGAAIPPFVIHDFRRAVRSGLGRLGVPPVVAELCLGHRQKGIAEVYDRHSYIDEKRAALMKWEARLMTIVAPAPDDGGKVVQLVSAR